MKLKIFDRVMVIVLTLCAMALAIFLFAVSWNLLPSYILGNFASLLTSGLIASIVTTIAALLVLVVCIRILFVRQRDLSDGARQMQQPAGVTVRTGDAGSTFITTGTMEGMAHKFISANAAVRECRVSVLPSENSIVVRCAIAFVADTNIPETTQQLQSGLKENMESLTGITVSEVQVIVDSSLAQSPAPSAILPRVQ